MDNSEIKIGEYIHYLSGNIRKLGKVVDCKLATVMIQPPEVYDSPVEVKLSSCSRNASDIDALIQSDVDDCEDGETVYYYIEGNDNYSFGTIVSNLGAWSLIQNAEYTTPLDKVHNSLIKKDRMEIVKYIANLSNEPQSVEQNKLQQQMLLFG
jgi:hypothetical protein